MNGFFPSSRIQVDRTGNDLVPKCGSCGLYKGCQSPKMPVFGEGRKRVLVVGEAPGQTEDEMNRPFIGKAGQRLRETLRDIGVDLDQDAWTTNSLICRPPNNATPDAKQIGYCRPNLLNAIREYSPRVIVTLGRTALASVLTPYWRDVKELARWTGWQIPLAQHWVCPTYHPSYLLRMNNSLMDREFQDHLQAAFAIEYGPPVAPDFESSIAVLYEEDDILSQIARMDDCEGWTAIDYETNCLKPEYPESRIVSCAVSNGDRTISFPWTKKSAEFTGIFLRSKRTKKIASNLKFEERWTQKEFGHGVRNWGWDTMLAAHCLDNRPGICSLKFQSLVKMGVPSYNEHVEPYLSSSKGHYNRIHEIELRHLLFYGGMDALLEYRLAEIQREELGE